MLNAQVIIEYSGRHFEPMWRVRCKAIIKSIRFVNKFDHEKCARKFVRNKSWRSSNNFQHFHCYVLRILFNVQRFGKTVCWWRTKQNFVWSFVRLAHSFFFCFLFSSNLFTSFALWPFGLDLSFLFSLLLRQNESWLMIVYGISSHFVPFSNSWACILHSLALAHTHSYAHSYSHAFAHPIQTHQALNCVFFSTVARLARFSTQKFSIVQYITLDHRSAALCWNDHQRTFVKRIRNEQMTVKPYKRIKS